MRYRVWIHYQEKHAMKHLFPAVAMMLSFNVYAQCPSSLPAERPEVPDGSVSSFEVMFEAQLRVERYVMRIEDYLACRQFVRRFRHDHLVTQAAKAADEFNAELAEYKRSTARIANN
jgi:hypothetical protein